MIPTFPIVQNIFTFLSYLNVLSAVFVFLLRINVCEESQILIADTIDVDQDDPKTHTFTCLDDNGKETKLTGRYATGVNDDGNITESNITSTEKTWIAFIRVKSSGGGDHNITSVPQGSHTCGGVLITQTLLLTAAHCCCDVTHCKARQVINIL